MEPLSTLVHRRNCAIQDTMPQAVTGSVHGVRRWPLHHVQEMLGHANVSQTSTYLNATRIGLHDSMRRFEVIPSGCNPVTTEIQTDPSRDCNEDRVSESEVIVN